MTTTTFQTKLRRDGYIHVPKRAQAALGLVPGDAVVVVLAVADDADAAADPNPAPPADETISAP